VAQPCRGGIAVAGRHRRSLIRDLAVDEVEELGEGVLVRWAVIPPSPHGSHSNWSGALVLAALDAIAEDGPAALSLRQVAGRAGVTHTAAAYHFGDKAGLLTAIAVEGYRRLGDALDTARHSGGFLDVGVAYVEFAVTNRAYFEVMFRPELHHRDDDQLRQARARTAEMLYGAAAPTTEQLADGVAAWAIVHGLATLWLDGNLPAQLGDDPRTVTRLVAGRLRVRRRQG
jgi:AcrR family transcriptional regulator